MYYWQDDQDQVRRLRVLLAARLRAVLAAVPTDVAAYAVTASRRGVAGGTPAYEDGPAGRLALARALRAQGRCQEALGAYQQALDLGLPADPPTEPEEPPEPGASTELEAPKELTDPGELEAPGDPGELEEPTEPKDPEEFEEPTGPEAP